MMNNKVTKVELKKVFKRSFMYGSSWNYERMQNLGFLYTILPVLKKLYPDKDSASPAMKRHLEFFQYSSNSGTIYSWSYFRYGRTRRK